MANYIISKTREAEPGTERAIMTPLKLQKILYFAQGWHLGLYGKPLFDDPILAWKMGPVVKDVYTTFRHYGALNLATTDWNTSTGAQLTKPEDKAFMDHTLQEYSNEDALALVDRTHRTDPWLESWANPFSKIIPQPAMMEYFQRS